MRPALRKWFSRLAVAGLLAVAGGHELEARSTPVRPLRAPSSSLPVVKLSGVEYVEATALAKRLGLQSAWMKKGERQVLKNTAVRIELEAGSREISVNGVRIFMGEGARIYKRSLRISKIDAERLLTPIVRPGMGEAKVPPLKVIALDAGHGGRDPGKENRKLKVNEKTFTLDVVRRAEKLLVKEGYKVVLTRKTDVFVDLGARPEAAAKAGADMFISVHFNAVAGNVERVSGTETYIMTPRYQRSASATGRSSMDAVSSPGNENDHWNALLGYHMQRALLTDLKTSDRGLKRGRLAVLRLATCPAVLVEAGFLSNTAETRKIATAAYRQKIAEAIVDGVKAYAQAVGSARK